MCWEDRTESNWIKRKGNYSILCNGKRNDMLTEDTLENAMIFADSNYDYKEKDLSIINQNGQKVAVRYIADAEVPIKNTKKNIVEFKHALANTWFIWVEC